MVSLPERGRFAAVRLETGRMGVKNREAVGALVLADSCHSVQAVAIAARVQSSI